MKLQGFLFTLLCVLSPSSSSAFHCTSSKPERSVHNSKLEMLSRQLLSTPMKIQGGGVGRKTGRGSIILSKGTDRGVGDSSSVVDRSSWVTLGALLSVYVSNQWSRSLIFYLVSFGADATSKEFMNMELGFDQASYSILASFGFTALFALSSFFAGRVADSNDRAQLSAGWSGWSCIVWGCATVGMGVGQSFGNILALRVVQGISQGFTTPAAYGLLADVFPSTRRATANSIYTSGVYLGGGLASLSALLIAAVGWRASCEVVGAVSILSGVATLLFVTDPKEREVSEPGLVSAQANAPIDENETLPVVVASIVAVPAVRWLFLASAFRFCAGFGIGVWAAPYFRQQFPSDQASYALANAFIVALGGFASSVAGGALCDRLSVTLSSATVTASSVRAWIMAASCLLAVPAWIATVQSDAFPLAMIFLLVEYIVAECWFGPAVSILQECVPQNRRGTAQGLFSMLTTFGNVAPVLMGTVLSSSELTISIRDVLLLSIPCFYLLASLGFLVTGFALNDALESE